MAISLKDLRRVKSVLPPRILIYGPHGLGKTTLANEFPNAVFLQVEDGTPGDITLDSFGVLKTYNEVIEGIASLYMEEHGYQTVVLDSLDKFEPLVWQATCEANKWNSIEDAGYGKGYIAADAFWRDYYEGLNALRRDRGMTVINIAHSEVERFDDPRTASYSRYEIRLHKRARALVQDDADLIAFINQDAAIKGEDVGFNKTRTHAEGGTQRWIYCEGRPSLNAKNRYGIPPKVLYEKGKGFAVLGKYFPKAGDAASGLPASEQAGAESQPTEAKTDITQINAAA